MTYTLQGVTLTQEKTASNIGYWKWGTGPFYVVFLHGISQTDNFVTGIPNFDTSRYERMTSGDHWGPLHLCNRMAIYDEFVSLTGPVVPPVEIPGSVVLIGNGVYGIFGDKRIKLN
jgi:hypothetical protein